MEKKYKLPKEFAEKWVKALRSGNYKQGKGKLKSNDNYCCLGVACQMQGASKLQISDFCYIPERSKIPVPKQLKGSAGSNGLIYDLTVMNDYVADFVYIADWIETNVEFI